MRKNKRSFKALRNIKIIPEFVKNAYSSCLIEMGDTRVICTASIEEKVPRFLRGTGGGWITAEYGMIPASCKSRVSRESTLGKKSGRTHEIQRLIGRSLRSVCDLSLLGEKAIWVDCDVIQADGGTRCAAITGSFVSLVLALDKMKKEGIIDVVPVNDYVAAVSVGIISEKLCLDLDYDEDSNADVDMNVVMKNASDFVEIQGTAEKNTFSRKELDSLTNLAQKGIKELIAHQKSILKGKICVS